jgi:exonuclease SbcD
MRILHTADWHIGANIDEARRCLQCLVEKAAESEPHLTIIAGDVFHSADVPLDSEAARLAMTTIKKLADLTRTAVIVLIGTPSHDGTAAKIFEGMEKVYVQDKPNSLVFDTDSDDGYSKFVVSCLPQPTKQYLESIIEGGDIEDVDHAMSEALTKICAGFGAARDAYADGPHICVGHFSVRGARISPTQQMIGYDIDMSTDQLNLANPTIWCLGHIHHAQEVAPEIFYSGSLYRVDFGERDSAKGFYLHHISADTDPEVVTEFIETPASSMAKVKLTMMGDNQGPDLTMDLGDAEVADKMQVEIRAYADQAQMIDYHIIREQLMELGAKEVDVIVQRIPRPNIRSAKILAVDRLREKLIARAELLDEPVPGNVAAKADMIQDLKAEAVLKIIKKQFSK